MTASKSFFASIRDFFAWLWGSGESGTPEPTPSPAPPEDLLAVMQPRVFVIVFNPVVEPASGKKLIDTMGWNDPEKLMAGYIADVDVASGGLVKYQIVGRIEVDEIPRKADGFQYSPQEYMGVVRTNTGAHDPDLVDYNAIIAKFDLLTRVAAGEFDEVWMFGAPYFGFWEAAMAGAGAFDCNGGPIDRTAQCPRRFVFMGFNYERGVGEMLEDLGHRAEATLAQVFGSRRFLGWTYTNPRTPAQIAPANLYERFLCFDQIAPGNANVGTVHYAPNSQRDYEWGVATPVSSCADDWLEFPNLPAPPNFRMLTTRDWGGGDIRAHHQWWLTHLPKAAGATNGIANNWWYYVIDPNHVKK